MLPTLREVLALPALVRADPVVLAGEDELDRPVRWVHVSELTDIAGLLEGGELILTTGIALPRAAGEVRRYVRELAAVGVSGLAVELGRRYRRELPAHLVAAAKEARLPLIELQRETPFVGATQAVHTVILDARMRELLAADERQTHRTLLTVLALSPELPPHAVERAAALGVSLSGRPLTGVVVRCARDAAAPAVLRDVANTAAETLRAGGVPALVGPLDDHRVAALVAPERAARLEPALADVARAVHAIGTQHDGFAPVIGVGRTLTGIEQAHATLREAIRVSDTAAGLTPRPGFFRSSDLRLHGLAYALRDSDDVREYVQRELGALLAHDADRGSDMTTVLTEYCRAGGNKTDTANRLFISRASLYDRLAKLERIMGVDLADSQVVLALHFALLVREGTQRPDLAVQAHGRQEPPSSRTPGHADA